MSGRRKKKLDALRREMTTLRTHPRVFRKWLARRQPSAPSARLLVTVDASMRRAKAFRKQQKQIAG